jgi:hypothetical protein
MLDLIIDVFNSAAERDIYTGNNLFGYSKKFKIFI